MIISTLQQIAHVYVHMILPYMYQFNLVELAILFFFWTISYFWVILLSKCLCCSVSYYLLKNELMYVLP